MIPIICQPEPDGFNENVRIPGNEFLKIHVNDNINIPPYWQKIEKELWNAYGGICSYFSIYVELVDGASSVDHFIPKSQAKELAYEWSNYRLSCIGANRKKHLKLVLDPFQLEKDSFFINFIDGEVFVSNKKELAYQELCHKTIENLGLNCSSLKSMRMNHFFNYINKEVSLNYLKTHSPFVYYEIIRQNLA
jgi:uncharacterized protein (TIGR02646 family)